MDAAQFSRALAVGRAAQQRLQRQLDKANDELQKANDELLAAAQRRSLEALDQAEVAVLAEREAREADATRTATQLEGLFPLLERLGVDLVSLEGEAALMIEKASAEAELSKQWRFRRRELQKEMQRQEIELLRLQRQLAAHTTAAPGRL